MSEKGLSVYDVQLVIRDNVECGTLFLERNIEPLAEGNRIEQRAKCKQSRTASITYFIKQINAVSSLMSN